MVQSNQIAQDPLFAEAMGWAWREWLKLEEKNEWWGGCEGRIWRLRREEAIKEPSCRSPPTLSISVCICVSMAWPPLYLPITGQQPWSFVLTHLVLSLEPLSVFRLSDRTCTLGGLLFLTETWVLSQRRPTSLTCSSPLDGVLSRNPCSSLV